MVLRGARPAPRRRPPARNRPASPAPAPAGNAAYARESLSLPVLLRAYVRRCWRRWARPTPAGSPALAILGAVTIPAGWKKWSAI
jgi:hypothetical protein